MPSVDSNLCVTATNIGDPVSAQDWMASGQCDTRRTRCDTLLMLASLVGMQVLDGNGRICACTTKFQLLCVAIADCCPTVISNKLVVVVKLYSRFNCNRVMVAALNGSDMSKARCVC